MTGIYKITDKTNGLIYIGQAMNIKRRFSEHKTSNKGKKGTIDYVIRTKGVNNFTFEVIEECTVLELKEREMYWIAFYDSYHHGYNLTPGGEGSSPGEDNINAILTTEDVIQIRLAYANHQSKTKIYQLYKDKIGWNGFSAIWVGYNWPHIMPEVFTEENKQWHIKHAGHQKAYFTDEEVMEIRKKYVYTKLKDLIEEYKDRCSARCIRGIISGENYKYLPIYKKQKKEWIDGGKY